MIYEFRQPTTASATPQAPGLTPAERALLTHAGPIYIEAAEFGPPESTLSAAVEPDDWRLYYLLRELPESDRARVLEFAELLYNLRHAQRWASGEMPTAAP
jgi:hypothetical protein